MDGGFITGFQGFTAAEATHYPALAGPLGRLVDALESVESVDRNPGPTLPVVDEYLDVALGAATGPAGELLRGVAHQVGWANALPGTRRGSRHGRSAGLLRLRTHRGCPR